MKRCCVNNTIDIMKFLIESGLNIDIPCCGDPYYHIINYVCYAGTCEMVKLFLDNGINVDCVSENLLSMLVNGPAKEEYDFIVAGGVTDIPQNFYNYQNSIFQIQFEKIKLLIDYGLNIQKQNILGLVGAIKKANYETVELLVNNGADINCAIEMINKSPPNKTIDFFVNLGFDPVILATLWFPK